MVKNIRNGTFLLSKTASWRKQSLNIAIKLIFMMLAMFCSWSGAYATNPATAQPPNVASPTVDTNCKKKRCPQPNNSDCEKTSLKITIDQQNKLISERENTYNAEFKRQSDHLTLFEWIIGIFIGLISIGITAGIAIFGWLGLSRIQKWENKAEQKLNDELKEIDALREKIEKKHEMTLEKVERQRERAEVFIARLEEETRTAIKKAQKELEEKTHAATEKVLKQLKEYELEAKINVEEILSRKQLVEDMPITTQYVDDLISRIELMDKSTDYAREKISKDKLTPELKRRVEAAAKKIEKTPEELRSANDYYILAIKEEDICREIELFTMAIKKNPDFVEAYYRRSFLFYKQDNFEKALEDINKVIELKPTEYIAYNYRGAFFIMQEQYERAIPDLTKAIELNEMNAFGYNNRGFAYGKINKIREALDDFDKAISIVTEQPNKYFNKACVLLMPGEFHNKPEAMKLIEKSVEKGYRNLKRLNEDRQARLKELMNDPEYKDRLDEAFTKIEENAKNNLSGQ